MDDENIAEEPEKLKDNAIRLMNEKKLQEAADEIKKAIENNPIDDEAYYIYGKILFMQKMYSVSALAFEIANFLNEKPEYMVDSALSYMLDGREDLAKLALQQAYYTDKAKASEIIRKYIKENYENNAAVKKDELDLIYAKLKILEKNIQDSLEVYKR